jgi:hypothetical protein
MNMTGVLWYKEICIYLGELVLLNLDTNRAEKRKNYYFTAV